MRSDGLPRRDERAEGPGLSLTMVEVSVVGSDPPMRVVPYRVSVGLVTHCDI